MCLGNNLKPLFSSSCVIRIARKDTTTPFCTDDYYANRSFHRCSIEQYKAVVGNYHRGSFFYFYYAIWSVVLYYYSWSALKIIVFLDGYIGSFTL